MNTKAAFIPADILLPKNGTDMTKWSVVACDQYTSEREYWEKLNEYVGVAPSTLRLTLSEIYLEDDDVEARIKNINAAMDKYLESEIFTEYKDTFIYVERKLKNGMLRRGIVGKLDLESYEYTVGSKSLTRATEGTVTDRIPPRIKVRENAALELPHIMVLIDDPQKTVIEPLAEKTKSLKKVYDFEMNCEGGHLTGYLTNEDENKRITKSLEKLGSIESCAEKYNIEKDPFLYAMGDGNHSLATAKEYYRRIKSKLGDEALTHPSRYALVEIVNLHDTSLEFEAIHRVVYNIDTKHMMDELCKYFDDIKITSAETATITVITENGEISYVIKDKNCVVEAGIIQSFIDWYTDKFGGKTDYIHGDDVTVQIGSKPKNAGFLLPAIKKSDLFKRIIDGGALPRKTFSMGESCDKRFYLEARKIK